MFLSLAIVVMCCKVTPLLGRVEVFPESTTTTTWHPDVHECTAVYTPATGSWHIGELWLKIIRNVRRKCHFTYHRYHVNKLLELIVSMDPCSRKKASIVSWSVKLKILKRRWNLLLGCGACLLHEELAYSLRGLPAPWGACLFHEELACSMRSMPAPREACLLHDQAADSTDGVEFLIWWVSCSRLLCLNWGWCRINFWNLLTWQWW